MNLPGVLFRYVEEQLNGCWVWLGAIDKDGYGRTHGIKTQTDLAHRFVYELLVAPIPEGLQIDHLCHSYQPCPGGVDCPHRRCVNPDHLEPVTSRINTLRGRGFAATNLRKTHCPAGHEYDVGNTYVSERERYTSRNCRACNREAARRYKERSRAS